MNNSANSGGGIYADNCNLNVYNSEFYGNSAILEDGGAVFLTWTTYHSIYNLFDNIFRHNSAIKNGGAIKWDSWEPLENNTYFDNSA